MVGGGGGRSCRVPAGERSKEEKIRKQHRALFIYFEVEGQARKKEMSTMASQLHGPPSDGVSSLPPLWHPNTVAGGDTVLGEEVADRRSSSKDKKLAASADLIKH